MLKLKEKSLNSSTRTPHETHKQILAYLSAGGFEEENRSRVFSDGERTIIVFSMNRLVSIAILRLLSRMRLTV